MKLILQPVSLAFASVFFLISACGGSAEDTPGQTGDGDGDGENPGSGDGDDVSTDPDVDVTIVNPGDGDGDAMVTPGDGDGDDTSMGGSSPTDPEVSPPPQEVEEGLVGQVPVSCGATLTGNNGAGPDPIDCTAHGDENAECVFGNHCWCSEGFQCAVAPELGDECEERVTCVPVR